MRPSSINYIYLQQSPIDKIKFHVSPSHTKSLRIENSIYSSFVWQFSSSLHSKIDK